MDKTILKKFAIESRKDLMEKIKNKINTFYIDEEFKKEQKGEIYVLSNEKHSLSLTNEEYQKRELLIKRIKELSLEQVIEEAAYTWFNRIIAIRYMEINDYLPLTKDNQSLGIRVLSSKDNTPDPEILKFTNLINPDLDIDFKKEKYVELKNDNEKFKYVLLLICKKLGRVIPQVFDGMTDYIDILIPDNLLNDTGFVTKLLNEVSEENYNQVEIIGWLYQYYNTDIFNKIYDGDMTKKKIEAELLPAATQLFTPEWVVNYMVENSLGKFWIEHSNSGEILKSKWRYFIAEEYKKGDSVNIENIKFLDPSSGSGHMLVYAFEIFYQMYEQSGYSKNKIAENILKYNLFGLDIDNRAGQLSVLSLLLKAREYDKLIFNNKIIENINVLSINECKSMNIESLQLLYNKTNSSEFDINSLKEMAEYLYDEFSDAKEYGSILKIKKYNYNQVIRAIDSLEDKNFNIFEFAMMEELKNKFIPIIKQAIILSQTYEIIVTNPPYLSFGRMNNKLSTYIKKNYHTAKSDLAVVFIDNAINNMCAKNGYISFITTKSWMYLQSFEDFRKNIVHNKQFDTIVDFGTELFDGKIGHLPIIAWVNKNEEPNYKLKAVKLSDYCYSRREEKCVQLFNKKNYYYIDQKVIEAVDGSPIAYWINENIQKAFKNIKVGQLFQAKQGMTTGNNNLFLRFWYEVNDSNICFLAENKKEALESKKKWFPYNKGGDYRKWYGNREYVVNWYNDGAELKEYTSKLPQGTAVRLKSQEYYFKEGITWSFIGSKFAARYSPIGSIFDVGGSSIFPQYDKEYLLSFFNSIIADSFLKIINPTMNYQIKDIRALPYIKDENKLEKIKEIYNICINIEQEDWDSFETSWDFKGHSLIKNMTGQYIRDLNEKPNFYLFSVFDDWNHKTEIRFNKLKENEEKLNEIFIDIYGLKDELTPEVEDKDITIRKADMEREIKSLISYAVGCMFGRYSLDKEGLIYAGGDFDEIYKKCKKTEEGWAGVSLSNYKVLNDNGQEIDLSFEVDNDNVIPITDEAYFSDDIVERFKTFISVVYGEKTLNENLDFIAETLGKKGTETSEDTIRRYFVNDFFNDHVKTYQKRPIYWLFDSGKKNGFKALVYMHRYNENLIPKVRLDYLHRMQTTYEKLLVDVNDKLTSELSMTDKKEAQKRQADLNAKLQEIREYDEKIAHIANQRISIDLDDGVKVNYDKFKDILAKIK